MSTVALHPVERRRIEQMMPREPHHDVDLRPLGAGSASTIIATTGAQDFIEALFDVLSREDWRSRLSVMNGVRRGKDGVLELGLPIHRRFHVALFEAVCRQPGSPRLDPARITAQGMVLRRRDANWSGWMKAADRILGWKPVVMDDDDPDPAERDKGAAVNEQVRALIAARKQTGGATEEMLPLYVVPPDVCHTRGRTILFGVIPVATADRVDGPADPIDYSALAGEARSDMIMHLSGYLKERPPIDLPHAGERLSGDWNVLDPPPDSTDGTSLKPLGTFLYQLTTELDAFAAGRPAAATLRKALAEIQLPLEHDEAGRVTRQIDAAAFLMKAAPILLDRAPNKEGLTMPREWPRIGPELGLRLTNAALACLTERHSELADAPGKFDGLTDQYSVRGFIRVRQPEGCPDKLVWSPYSEHFRVLPWWDGDGPGTKVILPDFSQLKKVKPNIAFEMPPAIANLLNKDAKTLVKGEGKESDTEGLQIGWLCSFSIPFITLCAFIVLNIFLSLFDLIFRWMMFIKICIPIPKKG